MEIEPLDVDYRPGDIPTLAIRGVLDLSATGPFEKLVNEMLVAESDRILLDFANVSFHVNSADPESTGNPGLNPRIGTP